MTTTRLARNKAQLVHTARQAVKRETLDEAVVEDKEIEDLLN